MSSCPTCGCEDYAEFGRCNAAIQRDRLAAALRRLRDDPELEDGDAAALIDAALSGTPDTGPTREELTEALHELVAECGSGGEQEAMRCARALLARLDGGT